MDAFASFLPIALGTILCPAQRSPSPALRTNPGLAVKPDFLEPSIRSLCDKFPFEAVCWLEADLVPDREFCSANLPWTQFPRALGPSREWGPGRQLLALWPAFLMVTPVLPVTDSLLILCSALLHAGYRMSMTRCVDGVIWIVSLCKRNPWTLCNTELPGAELTAESILSGPRGWTSVTLPSSCNPHPITLILCLPAQPSHVPGFVPIVGSKSLGKVIYWHKRGLRRACLLC